jgi:hypothetical protein
MAPGRRTELGTGARGRLFPILWGNTLYYKDIKVFQIRKTKNMLL